MIKALAENVYLLILNRGDCVLKGKIRPVGGNVPKHKSLSNTFNNQTKS
jgi:hypothetical protein